MVSKSSRPSDETWRGCKRTRYQSAYQTRSPILARITSDCAATRPFLDAELTFTCTHESRGLVAQDPCLPTPRDSRAKSRTLREFLLDTHTRVVECNTLVGGARWLRQNCRDLNIKLWTLCGLVENWPSVKYRNRSRPNADLPIRRYRPRFTAWRRSKSSDASRTWGTFISSPRTYPVRPHNGL